MKIYELLKWAEEKLAESCERPLFEAELLLAYHLQKERTFLHAFDREEVEDIEGYRTLVNRRANHEPYEYIVGSASFYDIELDVEAGVLIPRPETELLIDLVTEIIEKENLQNIAEIGVGSGAISIVLARKFPHLDIIATDIESAPIKVAEQNAKKYGVQEQITLMKTNLLDNVGKQIDLVVSNPPYIADDFKLEKNVSEYEPKTALFGGVVGDELLKEIVLEVKRRKIRFLACEMGYDQKEPLEIFFEENGIKNYKFYQDLAGFDRGFIIVLEYN
ncbi:MAG TPA: peptide chain release factor N(5)-glutamine methyltransferase [Campylobacterales bacterium]|nr:peptide chain release factor N(5)-glutamine methyltransferase [Campylobacterales bacterium]